MNTKVLTTLTACLILSTANAAERATFPLDLHTLIPTLDELSSDWLSQSQLGHYPSIHNFHGALLTNKDLLSVSWLVIPPFSQAYHSGTLYIDGQVHTADEFRWYAYQALRRKRLEDLEIETTTRMLFEDKGVLFRIRLKNVGDKEEQLDLRVDLVGIVSKFEDGWDWFYRLPTFPKDDRERSVSSAAFRLMEAYREHIGPIPNDVDKFIAPLHRQFLAELQDQGTVLLVRDKSTAARTAFAFAQEPDELATAGNQGYAKWKVTLKPGEVKTLDYVMAIGDQEREVVASAQRWGQEFDTVFQQAKDLWQKRFNDAFTPGNEHFSGNLPVLATPDKKLRRVYYMGALTLMVLHRTNLPIHDRVYLSGAPRLGATVMFYWDTSMWSTAFALLDPETMKQHLRGWLELDIDEYFAQDFYGGKGIGFRYSASYVSIFKMLYVYLNVTGDTDFLHEEVNGKTVLETMDDLSMNWKKLVREGDVLADFGGAWDLLECVPTYINRVPSLNAASVWMMRRTADIRETLGETSRPQQLRSEADALAQAVLGLYAPGKGYWYSLHRDGSRVEMRHCYDFLTLSNYFTESISPKMAEEMVAFVQRELLTKNWMRAQSLEDVAAEQSDRADHGPMGAYDGWLPRTMDGMCSFGYFDEALAFLHRSESATHEGAYAQAHELYGANKRDYDAPVRIAERDCVCREASCGGSFANAVITSFFGYRPEFERDKLLFSPETPRSFQGQLYHVRHKDKLYTISSTGEGLSIQQEPMPPAPGKDSQP